MCLAGWLWARVGVNGGDCGYVVKAKSMADGRFYEVFADNVGLCVNIRADLVDKHAVVQDDGLLWPRSKRCRGGSR